MINYSMLDTLNTEAFGADIDSFEALVMNIKDSFCMGCNKYQAEQYEKYMSMLKELKPDSKAFDVPYDWVKDREVFKDSIQSNTRLNLCGFKRVGNINADNLKDFVNELEKSNENELIGFERHEASKFEAVYLYGSLLNARALYKGTNGLNITGIMQSLLPTNVEEWEHEPRIIVYGDVYYEHPKKVYDNVQYCIRNNKKEGINYYCYLVDNAETVWEAFDELDELGFNIPEHAMIRGICKENYISYINQMISNFKSANEECESIVLMLNNINNYCESNNGSYYGAEFEVNKHEFIEDVYEAIVNDITYRQGIKWLEPILIIKKQEINDIVVKEISGLDINTLETYNIDIGSKIKFRVNNMGEPHICDETGKLILV